MGGEFLQPNFNSILVLNFEHDPDKSKLPWKKQMLHENYSKLCMCCF